MSAKKRPTLRRGRPKSEIRGLCRRLFFRGGGNLCRLCLAAAAFRLGLFLRGRGGFARFRGKFAFGDDVFNLFFERRELFDGHIVQRLVFVDGNVHSVRTQDFVDFILILFVEVEACRCDADAERGFLQKKEARKKVEEISKRYGLNVDLDAKVEDITVGMQQRVEILKMLYRDNEILIFDEPTAVLTPQEIEELMATMKEFAREGKSILFISHKLNEIMEVSDRVSVLRKGKYIGTVNTSETTKQELSNMMVGRPVQLEVTKDEAKPAGEVLKVDHLCVHSHVQKRNAVNDVSFTVRAGEIVCIAGIDGNGQTELVYGLTGLDKPSSGTITLCGKDISHASIRHRGEHMSHIPEDRHKHGLVLDFTLEQNMVLQRFNEPRFENHGFINNKAVRDYANYLIDKFDVRSGQGAITRARSMSGGNQQKAIIAREVDRDKDLIVAVQPTRGLDVGAIEFIHSQLVAERDRGKAILLVSLELDEVMSLSDRILVMYEGEIVGELDPKKTTVEELGLYMAGAKRMAKEEAAV